VYSAEGALREFGVRREHIQDLVDARIKATAETLSSVIHNRR
jgi:hypothetical protein